MKCSRLKCCAPSISYLDSCNVVVTFVGFACIYLFQSEGRVPMQVLFSTSSQSSIENPTFEASPYDIIVVSARSRGNISLIESTQLTTLSLIYLNAPYRLMQCITRPIAVIAGLELGLAPRDTTMNQSGAGH